MNKKKILAVSAASAVLIFAIPMTVLAYLRSIPKETENKVEILKAEETVTEAFTEPETQQKGENIFSKEVYVENTGSVPCFVRVYMDFSDSTIKAKSQLSADGTNYYSWSEYVNYLNSDTSSKWKYIPDSETPTAEALRGWFYYIEPLPVKDKNNQESKAHITTALLKALKTNYNDNYYDISDFQLIVYSETVQAVDENGQLIQDDKDDTVAWKAVWENFLRQN